MADFATAIVATAKADGVFANDPTGTGGETNKFIALTMNRVLALFVRD